MHVGNQMVSGTTLQTNMAATRTVIVEVKVHQFKECCYIPANSHACGLKTSISCRLTLAGQFLTPD